MIKFSSLFRAISLVRPQTITQRPIICIPCQNSSRTLAYSNHIGRFKLYEKFIRSSSLIQSTDLSSAASPLSNYHSQGVSDEAEAELNRRLKRNNSLWAKVLQCDIQKVEKIIDDQYFFHVLSPWTAEEKVTIFTSFNLPIELIHEQPQFLYHTSSDVLQKRLECLQGRGFLHDVLNDEVVIKRNCLGYYLECNNSVFKKAFQGLCNNQDALEGCGSQREYLQYRLKCSEDVATHLVNAYVIKRGVSHVRMKEILDFLLLEANITPDFVTRHIRLFLNLSVERLRSRFHIAKESNCEKMLYIWKMTEKKFKAEYEELF